MSMQGRLESTSGEVLAEGRLIAGGDVRRPVTESHGVPDVYWALSGLEPMLDGTAGVLIIDGAERVDVLVINGTLRPLG